MPVRTRDVSPAVRGSVTGTTAGVWTFASGSSTAHWVKLNVWCRLAGSVSPDGSGSVWYCVEEGRLLHLILDFEPAGTLVKGLLDLDAQGGSDRETGEPNCVLKVCVVTRASVQGGL